MTFAITYVEIDLPSFDITSPEEIVTYRWALPTDYLPPEIDCIPSIAAISFTPVLVSLGKDLGHRASISVSFLDHRHIFNGEPYSQGTFWAKWRGRYGTTMRGAPMRIIRGAVGQVLAEMDIRHYIVDASAGPDPNSGTFVVQGKDILKFADNDRAQAPVLSNGSLAGSITIGATAATLSPGGIGNAEYPASGFLSLGGKEVVSFTRVADALTMVRGQLGSVASAHSAGDRAQIVLRYTGNDAADIVRDLLVNYAGVDASYIDLAEWQAETSANLGIIYARTIAEPTSVSKLIAEMVEQAALAVWWDDRALKIGLAVLREISTDTATFDEDKIIAGSMRVQEQPSERISQIWTYYGTRDPTNLGAQEDNFRSALADVDLEKENEYGSAEIYKINGTWIETEAAAQRLNAIQLSRFRDPPRNFRFSLIAGELISLVQGYTLEWWANQNSLGEAIPAKIQITQISIYSDRIEVEAEEMLASGDLPSLVSIVFLTDTGTGLTYTVPASWNDADNSIHTIGGGEGGESGFSLFNLAGEGGGGGAYSGVANVNLTPGASLNYRVGIGSAAGINAGDTWFNGASLAASTVGAKGAANGLGGLASAGVGTTKHSGGNGGGGGVGGSANGGGGGGGAGGPNGDGADGVGGRGGGAGEGGGGGGADGGFDGGTPGDRKPGGNNRFSFGGGNSGQLSGDEGGGGAGGDSNVEGGPGGEGEQIWTQTVPPITAAGPGGGGGGGGRATNGGRGGAFGGGGGGGGEANAEGIGGTGGQGLIVILNRDI